MGSVDFLWVLWEIRRQRILFRGMAIFVSRRRRFFVAFVGNFWETNFILWVKNMRIFDITDGMRINAMGIKIGDMG